MTTTNNPEYRIRIGNVTASVFLNGPKDKTFRTVSVQRRYTKDAKVMYAENFSVADVSNAIRALELARTYLEGRESFNIVNS